MPKYITLDYLRGKYINEPIIEYPNQVKNKLKTIEVSVFMCTYNHGNYIRDSLEGILSQKTNFDFEFLISEDESSDYTREICKEYAQKFPDKIRLFLHKRVNNIKILGKPCGILPHVYNMVQTQGKYIAVCGGDDCWTDDQKLQKQYDYLLSHPDCSLVYQRWQEKSIKDDGSFCFGKTLDNFPKGSTSMFLNFKDRMPVQMLNVIQEDVFRWFILKPFGHFKCMEKLKPVVVNTPPESLTRSLSNFAFFKHSLNLKKNIYLAYKNTPRAEEAKKQYVDVLYSILINKRYKEIRLNCFYISIISIAKDHLLLFAINRILKVLKNKFMPTKFLSN